MRIVMTNVSCQPTAIFCVVYPTLLTTSELNPLGGIWSEKLPSATVDAPSSVPASSTVTPGRPSPLVKSVTCPRTVRQPGWGAVGVST